MREAVLRCRCTGEPVGDQGWRVRDRESGKGRVVERIEDRGKRVEAARLGSRWLTGDSGEGRRTKGLKRSYLAVYQ